MGVPKAPPVEEQVRRKGLLVSFFMQLWEWNVTPMSILRLTGPFGSSLLKQYTSRRFAHLEEDEAQSLHEYIYHISAARGSGEFALSRLLLPVSLRLADLVRAPGRNIHYMIEYTI